MVANAGTATAVAVYSLLKEEKEEETEEKICEKVWCIKNTYKRVVF